MRKSSKTVQDAVDDVIKQQTGCGSPEIHVWSKDWDRWAQEIQRAVDETEYEYYLPVKPGPVKGSFTIARQRKGNP